MSSSASAFGASLLFLAALAFPALAAPAAAWTRPGAAPVDVLKAHPKTAAAWRGVVPARWRRTAWIADLDGTTQATRIVRLSGRDYAFGGSCKPHECGLSGATFLIALDDGRATGAVHIDDPKAAAPTVFLGAPTSAEQALLTCALQPGDSDHCKP